MSTGSFFGDSADNLLERGVGAIKNQVQLTNQSVQTQVSGTPPTQLPGTATPQASSDEGNKDFLKAMYETSSDEKPTPSPQAPLQQQSLVETVKSQITGSGMTPEDAAKYAERKKELAKVVHKDTYYEPLVTRQKQEERPAEKIEREENEEKEKRWELQKAEEKKQPLPVSNKPEQRGSAG